MWSVSLFRNMGHPKSNGGSCLQLTSPFWGHTFWAPFESEMGPACNFTGLPRQIDIAAHLRLGALEPSAFSFFSAWEFDKLCRQRDIPSSFLISFREECGLVQGPKYKTILCNYPFGLGPQRRKCKKLKKWSTSLVILSLTVEIEDSVNAWYTPADAAGTT